MDKRYLTKMELCEEFGVVRSTMQRYMNMGLPRFRYKGKTYFDVIAAREWYEKHLEEIERESDDNLPEDFLEQMRNDGTL